MQFIYALMQDAMTDNLYFTKKVEIYKVFNLYLIEKLENDYEIDLQGFNVFF